MADLAIELAYAGPEGQRVLPATVPAGTTAWQAAEALRDRLPDGVQPHPERLAVFGRKVDAGRLLESGDRLEILRPLVLDPMEARRRRAARGA